MAKMRGIKPDFWTDSKVASVSPVARLLFIGMWTWACDNGHLDDDAMQLKMRVFPADAVTVGEVSGMVDDLVGVGLVVRGDGWLKVARLPDHQKVDPRYLVLCDQCDNDPGVRWRRGDRVERTRGAQRVPGGRPAGAHRVPTDEGEGEGEEREGRLTPALLPLEPDPVPDVAASAKPPPPKRRATRLPEGWEPTPELWRWAEKERPDLDIGKVLDTFRDHWASVGGQKGTKVDWSGTFRNWVRRETVNPTNRRAPSPDTWTGRRVQDLRYHDE